MWKVLKSFLPVMFESSLTLLNVWRLNVNVQFSVWTNQCAPFVDPPRPYSVWAYLIGHPDTAPLSDWTICCLPAGRGWKPVAAAHVEVGTVSESVAQNGSGHPSSSSSSSCCCCVCRGPLN